jgi:hypothetical protein
MGSFAGQKVVHPLARRRAPLDGKNLLRKMKMVPLRVGAEPKNAPSMRAIFLPNNQFTYGIFAVIANGLCNPECLSGGRPSVRSYFRKGRHD